MNARRSATLLVRGEVIVPVASLTIVLLIVGTLVWWGPARVQAQVQAQEREEASWRVWRPGPWSITVGDVPDGSVVPVEEPWVRTLVPDGERPRPAAHLVPGLQVLVPDLGSSSGRADVDTLHGVRTGQVEVYSHVVAAAAPGGYRATTLDLLLRAARRHADEMLVEPVVVTSRCAMPDVCPPPEGDLERVVVSGVEVAPRTAAPHRVTVAATQVGRVVVVVATRSPVDAAVPDTVDALRLVDRLAARVRADPPPPPPGALTEATAGLARAGDRPR